MTDSPGHGTAPRGTTSTEQNNKKNGDSSVKEEPPVMTTALILYWIVPLLILSLLSRWGVTTPEAGLPKRGANKHVNLDWNKNKVEKKTKKASTSSKTRYSAGYQEVLDIVNERRRKYNVPQLGGTSKRANQDKEAQKKQQDQTEAAASKQVPPGRGGAADPAKQKADEDIRQKRKESRNDPTNVYKMIELADAMRQRDLVFHDGGSVQSETLYLYQQAIDLVQKKKQEEPPEESKYSLYEEMFFPMESKSMDGLLCTLYTSKGKMYFMANMFEKAVESYQKTLDMEPLHLDALGAMGSSLLILGRYEEAGEAFYKLMLNDNNRIFMDVFTGMAKVLSVNEEAVPGGWEGMVDVITELIPKLEEQASPQAQQTLLADSLNRLHHTMFMYHDVKTHNTKEAWYHLQKGYKHKLSALPPWNASFEAQKSAQTKQIFKDGFWPSNVGSDSVTPIFIIGFVRSGSTLLERILDAHPLIVGTGEDSVFNGRLDEIRNAIVQASFTGSSDSIQTVVQQQADQVVEGMRNRWENLEEQVHREGSRQEEPLRFADKMLTNYMNVGFLHMLFPKALILHVAREPMDTAFSSYKHEFPAGTLDYTSDFPSLAQLYDQYRDIIEHWDRVLPGRVTHVRYEDMVHDMPGMAKAIIDATGLEWDDDVLEFHKKRHAVNTLSTTQVRKQVYKDSLQAWRRYEEELQPLYDLLGDHAEWDLKTTLPSYVKPVE